MWESSVRLTKTKRLYVTERVICIALLNYWIHKGTGTWQTLVHICASVELSARKLPMNGACMTQKCWRELWAKLNRIIVHQTLSMQSNVIFSKCQTTEMYIRAHTCEYCLLVHVPRIILCYVVMNALFVLGLGKLCGRLCIILPGPRLRQTLRISKHTQTIDGQSGLTIVRKWHVCGDYVESVNYK